MAALGLALSTPTRRSIVAPSVPPTPLGPDLAVNGGFDTASDWTLGSGWQISSGFMYRTETGGSSSALQANAIMIPGSIYRIRFVVSGVSGSDNRILARIYGGATVNGPIQTGNGVYQQDIAAPPSPAGFGVFVVGGFAGLIDNFSIREVNPGT